MSPISVPDADKILSLFAAALENKPFDAVRIEKLLPVLQRQGRILQARVLCTMSPYARRALSLFPEPDFFNEIWPGSAEQWPVSLPSEEDHPFFSVVTPSYNQTIYLQQTIDSVLRQDTASYEHIVIDGGSTDGTVDVLKSQPHLHWVSEPDRGQTHALNKALKRAKGEVIAWINSDDFYIPGAFDLIQKFFVEQPEESVVTGDCLWGWEGNGKLRYVPGEERDFESLIRQWNSHVPGPQPAIFFRRKLLDEVGYLDEGLHYGMDYDLWLRIAKAGYVRRYLPTPVSFYRFHSASKSGDQQDWSTFYNDWQTCFTRYRKYSRILPQERMLSVAYPLRDSASEVERSELCKAVALCGAWKLRDMEILLLTDHPGINEEHIPPETCSEQLAVLLPELPAQTLPLRLVPLASMDEKSFVAEVVKACSSFALCMPPISRTIPYEQWYVTPLGNLLDNGELLYSPLALITGQLPAHPLLSFQGAISCLAMHRVSKLKEMVQQ